jgi:hypothetical protein
VPKEFEDILVLKPYANEGDFMLVDGNINPLKKKRISFI